jgi:hypothetical protein
VAPPTTAAPRADERGDGGRGRGRGGRRGEETNEDWDRRAAADAARQALSRVAEVRAGSRQAPKPADASAVEALALALTEEYATFEADLAQKLGPDEARRLATAPEMCQERKFLRASDERQE